MFGLSETLTFATVELSRVQAGMITKFRFINDSTSLLKKEVQDFLEGRRYAPWWMQGNAYAITATVRAYKDNPELSSVHAYVILRQQIRRLKRIANGEVIQPEEIAKLIDFILVLVRHLHHDRDDVPLRRFAA